MDKTSVITLVSQTLSQDSIGQITKTETTKDVFCNLSSATRQEFFDAFKNGLKASLVATMFKYDYSDEKIAIIQNKRYYIYRTYQTLNDDIELYLEEREGITNVSSSSSQ